MKYSDIVYRCPGPHQRPGGTYAFRGVSSEAERAQALSEGWFATMPEAVDGRAAAKQLPPSEPPPTRDELEQKAKELGVKFDRKTSDEVLAKKISDAVGA